MGKKITLEIKYWEFADGFEEIETPTTHTQEFRFHKDEEMGQQEFEEEIFRRAHATLQDVSVKGFIAFDENKNQFFLIKPTAVNTATTTISDTIDIAE